MKNTKLIAVAVPTIASSITCARGFAFLTLCAALLAFAARGNTLTWTGGGGGNANWNNSANWGGVGTPGNGDTLVFQGALNVLNTNNIASLTLNQIRFGGGGGFHIRGNAFTLTNSIIATNSAGVNIIEDNITLATSDVLLVVSNSTSLVLQCALSGSVGVNKAGLGNLVYQGAGSNPYSGTTLVGAGTLQLNVGGISAFGGPLVIGDGSGTGSPTVQHLQSAEISDTAPITINNNGTLDLNNFFEIIGPNLALSGGAISTGTGTLTLSPNTMISTTNIFNDFAFIAGNLNIGSGTLTIQGSDEPIIFANVSGSANIVLNDSVQTIWFGSNSFTGSFTCNGTSSAGLSNPLALGNTNNTMTINGQANIYIDFNINITNQSLTINGGDSSSALYVPNFNGHSTNFWRANFIVNSASPIKIFTNCALTLNGPISGSGGFTKDGPGTLTFSGTNANNYAGTTTVSAGTLLLGKPFATTAVPGPLIIGTNTTVRLLNGFQINDPTTSITMLNSSLLDLAGFSEWVGPTSLQGAHITAGAGTLYFSGDIIVNASTIAQSVISGNAAIWNGTYTITNSGANFSPDLLFSANISSGGTGGGGLIKDGAGEVALTGNNSFTGPVTINHGDLWATTSTALGNTNTSVTVNSGGSLFLDGGTLDFGLKPLVLNGTGYAFGALFSDGNCTWGGSVTLASDSTIYPFAGSSLSLTGAVSGVGGYIKSGPGTNILSGVQANIYAGTTTANGGTLILGKSSGTEAVPANIVVNNGATVRLASSLQTANFADVLVNSGGLLDFSTFATYIDALRGVGTVNFGVGGWIVIGLNNSSSEFDGSLTGIGYAPGFTVGKTGSGTFTIGGNSSYTAGITHVFGGKVVINGSQPQIPVTVDAGASLGGTGTVGVVVSDGNTSPGNSPGILNSSNVIFSSTGNLIIPINGTTPGTGYSQLNVTGTASLASAGLQVSLGMVGAVSNQYTLINNDGADAVNGTFAGLPEGATLVATNGAQMTISYQGGTGNDVVLTQTSLPTPPTTAGIQQLGDGSIQLNGIGISNLSYTVWANTDLATSNWVSIGTATAPANSNAFQFVDANATNFPVRFYRFSWP